MIKAELITGGVLKVEAPTKLRSGDFAELARRIEPLMRQQGEVRLMVDASGLKGWENMAAIEEHAVFVKSHQQKVGRIAVISSHEWQHWIVGAIKAFLHPEVKVFDKNQENEALSWLAR